VLGVVFALAAVCVLASLLAEPADAQTQAPRVARVSVINGKVLSTGGAPSAFPDGSETVVIRGWTPNRSSEVLVRIEDFWSAKEWHPDRTCAKPGYQHTCASGTLATGVRFSKANITPAKFGGRYFSFKADLADGMYRIAFRARTADGRSGTPVKRWFKVDRNASQFLSSAQVLQTSPTRDQYISTAHGADPVDFRVETSTAAVNLDWSLRQDRTMRFWNEDSEKFAGFVTNHRRLFDGWRSIESGRTYYTWDLDLPPGNYTMWVTALDGRGKKGETNRRDFHVTR